jgi:hypothetical protein
MPPCFCSSCNGSIVSADVKRHHERSQNRIKTLNSGNSSTGGRLCKIIPHSQQPSTRVPRNLPRFTHDDPVLPLPDFEILDRTSPELVEQEMLDHGTLTGEDLDIMTYSAALPNLGPNIHDPHTLMNLVDYHVARNSAVQMNSQPLTRNYALSLPPDTAQALQQEFYELLEAEMVNQHADPFTDSDGESGMPELYQPEDHDPDEIDEESDDDDIPEEQPGIDEDHPDPFAPAQAPSATFVDLSAQPPHLQVIYALVTWLHLQFHLPRVACQAMLAILACILFFLNPQTTVPLVTLASANRALALDISIHVLPVCPQCKEVYPASDMTQATCWRFQTDLFEPDLTKRGKKRKVCIPRLRYPYLSISEQLPSILSTPGVEDMLDSWQTQPRQPGRYDDIFDGKVCKELKAYGGGLFFSNAPDELRGPQGKL